MRKAWPVQVFFASNQDKAPNPPTWSSSAGGVAFSATYNQRLAPLRSSVPAAAQAIARAMRYCPA